MPPLALALVFITLPFHRGAHYHGAFIERLFIKKLSSMACLHTQRRPGLKVKTVRSVKRRLFANADFQTSGDCKGRQGNRQRGEASKPEQITGRGHALKRRLQSATAQNQHRDVQRQDQQCQQQAATLEPHAPIVRGNRLRNHCETARPATTAPTAAPPPTPTLATGAAAVGDAAQGVMGGQHDGTAIFTVIGNMGFKLGHALFVQRGERLIEHPYRGARQIQTRQCDATPLTGRQGVARHVFKAAQANRRKGAPEFIGMRRRVQRAEPGKVFQRSEEVFDAGGMANPQHVAGHFAALAGQGFTVEKHAAGGWLHQAAQQAQQAGLAAAVRAADLQQVAHAQPQFEILEQQAPAAQQAQQAGLAAAVRTADLQQVARAQPQFEILEQQAPVALTRQRHGFKNGDRHEDLLFSSGNTRRLTVDRRRSRCRIIHTRTRQPERKFTESGSDDRRYTQSFTRSRSHCPAARRRTGGRTGPGLSAVAQADHGQRPANHPARQQFPATLARHQHERGAGFCRYADDQRARPAKSRHQQPDQHRYAATAGRHPAARQGVDHAGRRAKRRSIDGPVKRHRAAGHIPLHRHAAQHGAGRQQPDGRESAAIARRQPAQRSGAEQSGAEFRGAAKPARRTGAGSAALDPAKPLAGHPADDHRQGRRAGPQCQRPVHGVALARRAEPDPGPGHESQPAAAGHPNASRSAG
nr:hypothetical protein [Tanacetum cinerariifolium]